MSDGLYGYCDCGRPCFEPGDKGKCAACRAAKPDVFDAMVDDVLALTDEEVAAEVREDGEDLSEVAAKVRTIMSGAEFLESVRKNAHLFTKEDFDRMLRDLQELRGDDEDDGEDLGTCEECGGPADGPGDSERVQCDCGTTVCSACCVAYEGESYCSIECGHEMQGKPEDEDRSQPPPGGWRWPNHGKMYVQHDGLPWLGLRLLADAWLLHDVITKPLRTRLAEVEKGRQIALNFKESWEAEYNSVVAERDDLRVRLAAHVPCQACGWTHARAPERDEELPIVSGALDAQAAAETRNDFTGFPLGHWISMMGAIQRGEDPSPEDVDSIERWRNSRLVRAVIGDS